MIDNNIQTWAKATYVVFNKRNIKKEYQNKVQ